MSLAQLDPAVLKQMAESKAIVKSITGDMTYFPLCCSTGVLKGLEAQEFTKHDSVVCSLPNTKETRAEINNAKTIRALIRAIRPRGYCIMPIEWVRDYALDLIRIKVTDGSDDSGGGGYSNFKAAQVTWFDRYGPDKRTGKRFNSYNTTYACDDLTGWFKQQKQSVWGQILVSKPVDGAHGARVRGCVYTPNIPHLEAHCAAVLKEMKAELLAQLDHKGEGTWQIK